jgi:protein-S-isoprenylcysteine O-methyltransferase Ste14
MDYDLMFRLLFLVLFLLGAVIRGYYARRVRTTHKKRSIRERLKDTAKVEGNACAALLMAQGVYLIIAVPIYLLFSPRMFWAQLLIPDLLRWLGVGVGIISLPFLVWVQHTLGKHWTISLELQRGHTLVTGGPYRWVRHPMYSVHIVYFFTWVLVSANLLLLINYLLTIILIFARIPKEETMLLDRFGDEYRAYMKRTGLLLPRFRREAEREE